MRILGRAKQIIQKTLIANGVSPEYAKILNRRGYFSNFGEEFIVRKLLKTIPAKSKTDYVVDIAAADGVSMSNTYSFYKAGIPGLAVEFDGELFAQLSQVYRKDAKVKLSRTKVTPENIGLLLTAFDVPKNFSLLNLDIDSYDFFVLDALLKSHRPALICAEINEKIPPPLKFTVKYDPDHSWKTDHFFGQSISKLHELCGKYEYDLVHLHYNNAFVIPRETNKNRALSPEEAYDKGYRLKEDRKKKFPYNADMDAVLEMSPSEAKAFIEKAFEAYRGKFDLYL